MHQLPKLFNLNFIRALQIKHVSRRFFVFPHPSFALPPQVLEGIEAEGSVEFFLVDPVGSLDFPVVLRRSRADEFVRYAFLKAKTLEEIRAIPGNRREPLPFGGRPVGELEAVVGLDGFRGVSEEGDGLSEPVDRLVHGMLVGEMKEPLSGGLVQISVLVEPAFQPRRLAFRRDVFDVHLPFVPGVVRRKVFAVVPSLGIGFIRLVAIEPFQYPEAR